jgi:hypothetical protein
VGRLQPRAAAAEQRIDRLHSGPACDIPPAKTPLLDLLAFGASGNAVEKTSAGADRMPDGFHQ